MWEENEKLFLDFFGNRLNYGFSYSDLIVGERGRFEGSIF